MTLKPKLPSIIDTINKSNNTEMDVIQVYLNWVIQTELPEICNSIILNHKYTQEIEKELCELRQVVKELTQQKERFQHNSLYIEVVNEVILNEETEWDNKVFNNMLVKLEGRDEVFKVFVQDKNVPVVGNKIKFVFNADENKLSKLKIIE